MNKERNCAECGFQAHDLVNFRKHMELVHTQNGDFKCTKCVFHGESSRQLSEHIQMQHIFESQLNGNSSDEIRAHKRNLHSSTKFIKCQACQQSFESSEMLSYHTKTEHANVADQESEYNCTGCSFQATEQKYLRKHIELVHTIKQNFACSRCDYRGITSSELSKHIEQIHIANEVKQNLFNFTGTNRNDLKPHTPNDHEAKDVIRCRICGETCMSKGRLMEHRKKEHINTVAYCKNNLIGTCLFSYSKCYWNHDSPPDATKTGQIFKCYICSKTFSEKKNMMTHKKKEHIESIRYCNLFSDEKCPFKDEACWFRHTVVLNNEIEKDTEETQKSVFQKVQEDLEPPIVQN